MARDQTDADYDYGKLLLERRRLTKLINESAAGASEMGFSAESRAEWALTLKQAQSDLVSVEAKIRLVEPQGKPDRAKRHARDLEEAAARRRRDKDRGGG